MLGAGIFVVTFGCSCLLLSLNRLGGDVTETAMADRTRPGGPPGATAARESARQWRRLVVVGVASVLLGGVLIVIDLLGS